MSDGSLTDASADYRRLVENTVFELNGEVDELDDPVGVIHDEADDIMSSFSDREILKIFADECDDDLDILKLLDDDGVGELRDELSFKDMRYAVHRNATNWIKEEVL